jgi:23S rRNA pseudouridine1911/1915/1917 synthase
MRMDPVVLFEDNHCLAVAKPAPLLTQGVPAGPPTLEGWAKDYLRTKYGKPGNVYLGVPHRLDRPVSGVVLFARNSKAAARLAEQFQLHQVEKIYWAIVDGAVEPAEGLWEDFVRKVPGEARVEIAPPEAPGAKPAVVRYRVVQPAEGGSLLELRPLTGRTHQLRIQTAVHGIPIRGDELYGSRTSFGPPPELSRNRVIALHARRLTFLHPIRYEPTTVTAPLPGYWPASLPSAGEVAS